MKNKPTILIIIGISGDLSKKKLLPAISKLKDNNSLPDEFKIVGVTRQDDLKIEDLLINTKNKDFLKENMEIFQMDLSNLDDYIKLKSKLKEAEGVFKERAQYLFYLSVPPKTTESIVSFIGEALLSEDINNRILLEKPFGNNFEDLKDLIDHINKYFKEEQVYRIDHYLLKEAVQNIVVFRQNNYLFKNTWNKDFIEKIEIIASEEIDIEGRVSLYEQTGALKDFVQNHLLELLSVLLMDLPEDLNDGNIFSLRSSALKDIYIPNDLDLLNYVKRGQYKGYKEEVNNQNSLTETFVSVILESKNKNWQGVRINLKTGKALKDKFAQVKIVYKKNKEGLSNELILKLNQEEGVSLDLWIKEPGHKNIKEKQTLSFSFKDNYTSLPEAYEQVFFNAIEGNRDSFVSEEEALETWRIIDPILKFWESNNSDLIIYEKGSDIRSI